jgi:hypothetical protein
MGTGLPEASGQLQTGDLSAGRKKFCIWQCRISLSLTYAANLLNLHATIVFSPYYM